MNEIAWINGQVLPLDEACVPINDRGYVFGDGVYEVARGYRGKLFALDRHWRRLARSLREIRIDGVDLDALRDEALGLVDQASVENPLLYVQITRGVAPRKHQWGDGLSATIVMTLREASAPPRKQQERGVDVITVPDIRWGRCDIKSLNLLANVMAKQQAHEAGAFEAVFRLEDGTVTEGSSTSVMIVRDGVLQSPPDGPRILPSITRDIALELAADLGIGVREAWFSLEEMLAAEEVLLAGTSSEIIGVCAVDGQALPGAVGPVARRLLSAYHDVIHRETV